MYRYLAATLKTSNWPSLTAPRVAVAIRKAVERRLLLDLEGILLVQELDLLTMEALEMGAQEMGTQEIVAQEVEAQVVEVPVI